MKKEFIRHKIAYSALICGLSFFIVLFLGLWPNRMVERVAVTGLILFYFLWGVITHVRAEHISRRIVFEYIGVSLLAGSMLMLITL